ncbi:MAG: LPXTG cell wall anchor domain-containing protein [Chloroflexota bacterium]|nr:LPXTG cell wall anchor domain-containing protein [Chloroflexota bacterium]
MRIETAVLRFLAVLTLVFGLVLTSAVVVAASPGGSGNTSQAVAQDDDDDDDDDDNGTGTLPNTGAGTVAGAGQESGTNLLLLGGAAIVTLGAAYAVRRRLV